MSNTFQYSPGRVKLENIIHSNENQSTDITALVKEINIHSSVNIKATIVEFVVSDSIAYISKAPLQAGDVISFDVTYEDGTIERRVKIMEINSIISHNNRSMSYIIKAASDLRFVSSHKKVSRAFSGTPSDIAAAIVTENSQGVLGVWETSANMTHFVAPKWDPIACCKYLAGESQSPRYPARMKFFQDSKMSWNFTSLPNIKEYYSSKEDVITYTHGKNTLGRSTSNGTVPNGESFATAILEVHYKPSFNLEDALNSGNIQNTNYSFDLTTGQLHISTNNRWDTYSKNNLNEGHQFSLEDFGEGNVTIDYYTSVSTTLIDDTNPATSDKYDYDKSQEVEIVVPGNQVSDVGQIVRLEFVSKEPRNETEDGLDKRWSGMYLITAKRDVIANDTHKMVLRCSKDSTELT